MEELQLALSRAFGSLKAPAVSVLDEGDELIMNLSWVIETGRDTTLDSRCSASIRFASRQIDRYSAMATDRRRHVQARLIERLRDAFTQSREGRPNANECSLDMSAEDGWFDAPDAPS
ncbi:hypothetical protein [Caballeronia ptereochthonis]|uniref:Uncharacterized protein n=1 Tax=Caballeronia ptereochthonis TaxID=1777144 RepID=A0A158B5Q4_9BURK|nr:hypothetical protein [Caballeronia ptereochthonis]SAK65066.1 hypothetical protein AWB83_02790 [Caballeronia ptereochthonis]